MKRVKCANCGMIYDLVPISSWKPDGPQLPCPKCGSNAYDIVKETKWEKG